MRVKLLCELDEFWVGDEVELADNRAIALITAGFAVPAKPKLERATKKPSETRKK